MLLLCDDKTYLNQQVAVKTTLDSRDEVKQVGAF